MPLLTQQGSLTAVKTQYKNYDQNNKNKKQDKQKMDINKTMEVDFF